MTLMSNQPLQIEKELLRLRLSQRTETTEKLTSLLLNILRTNLNKVVFKNFFELSKENQKQNEKEKENSKDKESIKLKSNTSTPSRPKCKSSPNGKVKLKKRVKKEIEKAKPDSVLKFR